MLFCHPANCAKQSGLSINGKGLGVLLEFANKCANEATAPDQVKQPTWLSQALDVRNLDGN
jgi:hypothetical protein